MYTIVIYLGDSSRTCRTDTCYVFPLGSPGMLLHHSGSDTLPKGMARSYCYED